MATVTDQDRFFSGELSASLNEELVAEGTLQRLINGRFVEGAISNALGYDELNFTFIPRKRDNHLGDTPFTSPIKHQTLLEQGDVQLVAPMDNIAGKFIVAVISGSLYELDVDTLEARDITPIDAFLPESSDGYQLSFTDNDGGTLGVGGYLVIFNYPNKSIIINQIGARLANPGNYEVPPSRMGATGGSRMAIISGDNLMYVSDPLGGAESLAPLTFKETLDPNSTYYDQIFTIGSALDIEYVTSVNRIPRYMSASQDFLAQQLLVSTTNRKYLIGIASSRDTWEQTQFITYIGSTDGVAGPSAATNVGDVIVYTSTGGRIKAIGQDQQRESSLSETFMDDPLGQYLCLCETNFYFRDWYDTLDHSRSIMSFIKDRLYCTVYPIKVPAIGKYGEEISSPTFRAMAVASLDSGSKLGPSASLSWESFYDWINPIGLVTIRDRLYIVSKNEYGKITYHVENRDKVDTHNTVIYTRGYFANTPGQSRSILKGSLFFRRLAGTVGIKISYLIDNEWICGTDCKTNKKLFKFSFMKSKCKTDNWSVPLKIEIIHNGCRFELQSIRVVGEVHREEKKISG
jgi:hypothetical protein